MVFLSFAGGASSLGLMKLYVRPKEAMERVAGTGMSNHEVDAYPPQPGISRHGEAAGQPGSGVAERRDGDAAAADSRGLPKSQRSKVLYGAKAICAVLLPVLATVAVLNSSASQSNKFMAILWRWRPVSSGPTSTSAWWPNAARKRSSAAWPMRWI